MLQPMSKGHKNRILRSLALACTENIHKLNKYAYRWIHIKSGFIAHTNIHGFIGNYASHTILASAVVNNASDNTRCNYRKGEKDYEYYKQSADMYSDLLKMIEDKKKIPDEKSVFVPPKITDCFKDDKEADKTRKDYSDKFLSYLQMTHFECYDRGRADDLAYAAMLIDVNIKEGALDFSPDSGWMDPDKVFDKEFTFPSGNTGTISQLLNVYHSTVWEMMDELIHFSPEPEPEEEDEDHDPFPDDDESEEDKPVETVRLGEVGVDSGQLMICDPCYIASEWRDNQKVPSPDYFDTEKNKKVISPRKRAHEDINFGSKYRDGMTYSDAIEKGILKEEEMPDLKEFSYAGCCSQTLRGPGGQLNYKKGHAGAGVAFSSGYGDGVYPVTAEIKDGRVSRIIIDF